MAQLYLTDPVASVTRPVRQLIGFTRVDLAAGETGGRGVRGPRGYGQLHRTGPPAARRARKDHPVLPAARGGRSAVEQGAPDVPRQAAGGLLHRAAADQERLQGRHQRLVAVVRVAGQDHGDRVGEARRPAGHAHDDSERPGGQVDRAGYDLAPLVSRAGRRDGGAHARVGDLREGRGAADAGHRRRRTPGRHGAARQARPVKPGHGP
ncbi:fibronectin type III-like domain-contianing protein [Streptomyces sp. DSM 40750]|uniref:fibronectin type III-like domain-contianing protein n=1 Tax=Streptomyces sp. DSM 40750 TaxID=2801030 RepID=UPI003FA6FA71